MPAHVPFCPARFISPHPSLHTTVGYVTHTAHYSYFGYSCWTFGYVWLFTHWYSWLRYHLRLLRYVLFYTVCTHYALLRCTRCAPHTTFCGHVTLLFCCFAFDWLDCCVTFTLHGYVCLIALRFGRVAVTHTFAVDLRLRIALLLLRLILLRTV